MKINEMKFRIGDFKKHLEHEQKSVKTIKTYLRAVAVFIEITEKVNSKKIVDAILIGFKEHLINSYTSATVNTYIIGLNTFLSFLKYRGIKIKCVKRQNKDYVANPISEEEYKVLVKATLDAGGDNCALFRTMTGSGLRVNELKFITVEAITAASTEIVNKGKVRQLYLSDNLCRYLLSYCVENDISEGVIFTGRDGVSPLSTSAIWSKINNLSEKTGIDKKKLHPHNLRHFYASKFMRIVNDLNVLKDLLGHSDIKTTTIYVHPDGDYIRKCVNKIIA